MAARKKAPERPDTRAGIQPSVRVFTTWTPALIRAAEQQADTGNLRAAANLCDWIIADERAGGALRQRTQALLGLDPSFEASSASDKRRANSAIKALDAKEDWWAAYPESELAQIDAWGILLGLAPARHQPEKSEDHGGRILPLPEFWHPQHVRFEQEQRRWLVKVARPGQIGWTDEEELVPGGGTWLLHTPYGKNRPWVWGLWRGLAPLVLLKHLAFTDWAIHGEKGALLVGTEERAPNTGMQLPAGTSTKELRQQLAQDLYQRGRDGVAILPAGFDLKLVEAMANTKNIYDAQIEMANTAITIGIRGGNLTTEVKGDGGTQAATRTQANVNERTNLQFDATALTTTIHDQSLVWWAVWNFGDRKLAPWPVYPTKPPKDTKTSVDVANVAADVAQKFESQGWDVDRKEFAAEYELDGWLKPGEKPKAPPAPTPAPGAPAPTPTPGPGSDPEQDEPDTEGAQGRAGQVRLASGAAAAANEGFADGQAYAETLHDWISKRGVEAQAPDLEQLAALIRDASGYDDLKAKLEEYLGDDFDPDELAELTARTMILAELAGRLAVRRDVPELRN